MIFRSFVSLSIAVALAGSLPAAAKTPLPEFTGDAVYVVGVSNDYASLRADIERIQRESRQTYYVIAIASSGSGEWATRDYVDELYRQWVADARRRGLSLDSKRSVLILVAEQNRQISLHCGTELQTTYGLTGPVINRELVDPHFLPHARAGDYVAGLRSLLEATEQFIRARDAEEQGRREAAARRAADMKRSAETALAAARQLHQQTRKEIDARRAAGFRVDEAERQWKEELARLEAAEKSPAPDPAAVVADLQALQQRLQSLLDQLRQLPARQAEADEQTRALETGLRKFEADVEQALRDGLPAQPLQARARALQQKEEANRATVNSDPAAALATLATLRNELESAQQQLAALPQLRKELDTELRSITALQRQFAERIAEASAHGVPVADFQKQLTRRDQEIAAARPEAAADYGRALQTLGTNRKSLEADLQAVDRRLRQHIFATRTLPMGILLALAAVAAAAVSLRLFWYRHRRRKVGSAFEQYKQYTVELLDRLESLKKRHQLLPFSDTDYVDALSGETLAFYNQFDELHDVLRQHWLRLMEVRQQADVLMQSAGWLRAAPLREAEQQLSGVNRQVVEDALNRCLDHLQRLEQAHELARTTQQAAEQSLATLQQQFASLQTHGLSTAPYQNELHGGQADLEAAKNQVANDPLGALAILQTAAQRLKALEQLCGAALDQAEAAARLDASLQEAARVVQEQRGSGMRLTEEGGNPDPLLAAGRERHQATRDALDAGQVEVARNQIQQGVQAAEQAVAVVREQVEARRICEQAIPEQRREAEELVQRLAAGRAEHEQLEREHASESWSDVAGHVKQAAETLAASDAMLRQAAEASSVETQRYRQGRDLVRQVGELQQRVRSLFEQLRQRLDTLRRLREESQREQQQMLQRAEDARRWIDGHERVVGNQARELLAVARNLHTKVEAGWGLDRPNWPQLREWLEQAAANYRAAFEQASDDVRTYELFTSRLRTIEEEARRVERFLQSNTADRPRASQRCQAARQELRALLGYESSGQRDWRELQKRLEGVAADLQKAEQWAQEDIRIAQQAEAEIREAERAIDAASSFYEQGASADVSSAKSYLEQARRELAAQAYEQAIQKADQAELAARQALAEAQNRAEQRRRQRELEHRRRAAAAAAAMTAALPSVSTGTAASPHTSTSAPTSSSSSSSSTSSASSWSSGSSQRGW